MKYPFWIIIISGLFVVITGAAVVYGTSSLQHPSFPIHTEFTPSPGTKSITSEELPPLPTVAGTTVTLVGELVCLPNRAGDQKAVTPKCAIGLRTAEGQYYALQNINPYIIEGKVTMGQRVQMTGLLRSDTDTKYDTVGIIHVTSVNKLS